MIPVYPTELRRSVIRMRFWNIGWLVFDVGICVLALMTGNAICAAFDAFFAGIMLMLTIHNFTFYDLNPEIPTWP